MKLGVRSATALIAALLLFSFAGVGSASAQSNGHVYLMRGLANIFSTGMDALADKLNSRGIRATVHEYGQWAYLADSAAAESRANGGAPIVIIGHSLGADAAIQMAERLTALGTPARLIVTFDPVGVTQVGAAGGRFVNYYQDNNGFGKRLSKGPGFRGSLTNRNLDSLGGVDHFNIEKSPGLHAEVISAIGSLSSKGKSSARSGNSSQASSKPKAKPVARKKPASSSAQASGSGKPESSKPSEPARPADAKPEPVAASSPSSSGGSSSSAEASKPM